MLKILLFPIHKNKNAVKNEKISKIPQDKAILALSLSIYQKSFYFFSFKNFG
jgi:hypothetical protein